jgi:formate--tetrahydrofolate ligase
MSILGLASDLDDLRARLERIVIGRALSSEPVTAADLGAAGAMTALLRDALDPNLVQTCEGTPALVHAGPFANISFGNSSALADRVALRHADWVVTEAGFGADMGAEKFFDIKCRATGLAPDVAVLVATVRGLKAQSGMFERTAGSAWLEALGRPDLEALGLGLRNLEAQIANVLLFGIPVVVAINPFGTDSKEEVALLRERALEAGARRVAISDVFETGGAGGAELAEAVAEVAESGEASLRLLYKDEDGLRDKIWAVATGLYGAESVRFAPRALDDLQRFEAIGFGHLPVCVAKTQYSLSHDPTLLGRPEGFELPIREVRLCAGAGFVVPLAGEIMTMPGMGRNPAYRRIDVGRDGGLLGLG